MRTLDKRRQKQPAEDAVRLEPTGNAAGPRARGSLGMGNKRRRRRERTSPTPVIPVKHGKPVSLPGGGRKATRPTEGNAGKGRGKKRTPPGNRADTGCH